MERLKNENAELDEAVQIHSSDIFKMTSEVEIEMEK